MKYGIKFNLKDGTADYYDPLYKEDFSEAEDEYRLNMSYTYEISKEIVESYEWYDICKECGYELEENKCWNCKIE